MELAAGQAIRDRLADLTKQLIAVPHTYQGLKDAAQKWLDTMEDGKANAEATKSTGTSWRDTPCP